MLKSVANSKVLFELLREKTKRAGKIMDAFIEVVGPNETRRLWMGIAKV